MNYIYNIKQALKRRGIYEDIIWSDSADGHTGKIRIGTRAVYVDNPSWATFGYQVCPVMPGDTGWRDEVQGVIQAKPGADLTLQEAIDWLVMRTKIGHYKQE